MLSATAFKPAAPRAELAQNLGCVLQVSRDGNARANEIADATLAKVRTAMTMTYPAG